jgi:mannosyltransferase
MRCAASPRCHTAVVIDLKNTAQLWVRPIKTNSVGGGTPGEPAQMAIEGISVQASGSHGGFSSPRFARCLITALLALAVVFVAAAALFPAQQFEQRRLTDLASRRDELTQQAAGLQPSDDTYIKVPNTPYPINTIKLFPVLLLVDAVLLIILAGIFPTLTLSAAQKTRARYWRFDRADWLLVIGLTASGASLRVIGSNRGLWIDEISTMAWYVRAPTIDTFIQALTSNNHLLNSLLSRIAVTLFGEHEWALRLPAIIFGTLSIPLLYFGVRRYSGRVEASLAALALTVSYHHVFFSQDARGYSAMVFGALLGTFALLEALEQRSLWAWAVYCLGMFICVGSVAIGAVVLAGQLFAVSLYRPNLRFYVAFAITSWLLLQFYFFVIPDVLGFVFGDYAQTKTSWHSSNALQDAVIRGLRLDAIVLPVLLCGAALVGIGIRSYFRQEKLLVALLLAPEVIMAVALATTGVAFEPRFFIFVLPVVIIFAARGASWIFDCISGSQRNWLYAAAFVSVLAISVFQLRIWWRFPMQDFMGARQFVESHMQKDDAVVAVGIAGSGYHLYYWPDVIVENRVSAIQDLMMHHPRVWLLYTFKPDMHQRRPKLTKFALDNFVEQQVFPGMIVDGEIHVSLFSRPSVTAGDRALSQ